MLLASLSIYYHHGVRIARCNFAQNSSDFEACFVQYFILYILLYLYNISIDYRIAAAISEDNDLSSSLYLI